MGRAPVGRAVVGMAISLAAIVLAAAPAGAHRRGIVLEGFGTARVDGVIGEKEWKGAARYNLRALVPAGGSTPASILVMNDKENIYLGFEVARPKLGGSHVGFWFDNDHDGVSTTGHEDGVSFSTGNLSRWRNGFLDEYRCPQGFCSDIAAFNGRRDGEGAAKNDGRRSSYELSHPLASGDTGHDFTLRAGRRIGFAAVIAFFEGDVQRNSCVATCDITDPARFADIVIAKAPPVLGLISLAASPSPPQAGARFSVRVIQVELQGTKEVVHPSSVNCQARIGPSRLEGLGCTGCAWRIPASARGRVLSVSVRVEYRHVSKTASQSFSIV